MRSYLILPLLLAINLSLFAQNLSPSDFQKDWEEFNQRPIPQWFNEAKFGIFVVWGPYSVPSWMPVGRDGYAEWYWNRLVSKHPRYYEELEAFHSKRYGDLTYEDLTHEFKAELFDADQWCDLFARSGARYVVTTANYHDGFAMYPTQYAETASTKKWNSALIGPQRDIIGELNEAGEKAGLKMGIYYSLMEWYHPLWLKDKDQFVSEFLHPKFKEVVTRYKPWSIFLDGDWTLPGEQWRSNELARWLYQESTVKDYVVVNDRWGSSRGINGDVHESEYGYGRWTTPKHPWQEDRGIGESYGYNRKENVEDYASAEELIRLLSQVSGGGGNLLLCVGPTGDGRIPVIMQERLIQMGEWLKINGKAIYGTKANPFWPRTFEWGTITSKKDTLFLHVLNPDTYALTIEGFEGRVEDIFLTGKQGRTSVSYENKDGNLSVYWPSHENLESATILTVVTKGQCSYDPAQHPDSNEDLFMTARAFTYTGNEIKPRYKGYRNRFQITNWNNAEDHASAELVISRAGTYRVLLTYVTDEQNKPGSELEVEIAGQSLSHTTKLSAEDLDFEFPEHMLGELEVDKAGPYKLLIKPKPGGKWNGFGFKTIKLESIPAHENEEHHPGI